MTVGFLALQGLLLQIIGEGGTIRIQSDTILAAATEPGGGLTRLTGSTLASREAVLADLDQIRERGYAVARDEPGALHHRGSRPLRWHDPVGPRDRHLVARGGNRLR